MQLIGRLLINQDATAAEYIQSSKGISKVHPTTYHEGTEVGISIAVLFL